MIAHCFLSAGLLAASFAGDNDSISATPWVSTLLNFLPFAIFFLVLYWLLRRQLKSPLAALQRQYLERQIEHTQQVEALLGRIATALEKNHDER